jgi:hypothetical protein
MTPLGSVNILSFRISLTVFVQFFWLFPQTGPIPEQSIEPSSRY